MIRGLVDFALNNRFLIIALAILLFVGGAIAFHQLPVEAYPDVGERLRRDHHAVAGDLGGTGRAASDHPAQSPGWFIKPGRSNAIDGYLIYEVPGACCNGSQRYLRSGAFQ